MTQIEEIDRLVKLINDHVIKLKELNNLYQMHIKRRLMLMFYASIVLIAVWSVSFIYMDSYEFRRSVGVFYGLVFIIFIIIFMLIVGYFMINYLKDNRNRRDIIDEIILVQKQLKQLIRIASQYREHIFKDENSFLLFEIDLKLTEAEDIISRVKRIHQVKSAIDKKY